MPVLELFLQTFEKEKELLITIRVVLTIIVTLTTFGSVSFKRYSG